MPKARDTLLASSTRPWLVLNLKNLSLPAQLLKTSLFKVLTHQLACARINRNVGVIFTGIVQFGLPSTNCQIGSTKLQNLAAQPKIAGALPPFVSLSRKGYFFTASDLLSK